MAASTGSDFARSDNLALISEEEKITPFKALPMACMKFVSIPSE
jgi:hypothetical protein